MLPKLLWSYNEYKMSRRGASENRFAPPQSAYRGSSFTTNNSEFFRTTW